MMGGAAPQVTMSTELFPSDAWSVVTDRERERERERDSVEPGEYVAPLQLDPMTLKCKPKLDLWPTFGKSRPTCIPIPRCIAYQQ